jgi:hypothetical protein
MRQHGEELSAKREHAFLGKARIHSATVSPKGSGWRLSRSITRIS